MNLPFDISTIKNLKLPGFLSNPMIFIGTGLVLILMMTFLLFSGSSDQMSGDKAFEQGRRAISQLGDSVQAFMRVLKDEQVTSLAEMALADPEATDDLSQYLAGRLSEFDSLRLFESTAWLKRKQDLGENAWIAIDMIMNARDQGAAPVQIIGSGEDALVAGLVAIGEVDDPVGYLMVMAKPELILSGFNMTLPQGGYIALQQNHGRFTHSVISAFGDPALATQTSYIPVPGSLLRVVIPQADSTASFSGPKRLAMFILGAMLLAFGVIMRQHAMHPVVELKEDPASLQLSEESGEGSMETQPEGLSELASQPDDEAEVKVVVEDPEPALPPVSLPDLPFNVSERRNTKRGQAMPVELKKEIFRAYDIRGIVGETLDEGVARQVGQAIGSLAMEEDAGPVMVGRDGRHSGPDLVAGMIEGISSTGCDVVDVGAVPTGVLYYAAYEHGKGSGVMVTGSHNPPDYNGFKVLMGGKTLAGDRITALYDSIESGNLRVGKGNVTQQEILEAYRDRIAGDIQLERPLKIVADCGNGIGGICAADVLRSIGAEVLPMFDEVDGDFPNHHPDPSDPKNLKDLIETVKLMDADLGVAFDGDADRLGVVTPSGEIIFSDRLMILFIREILGRNPGAKIIYDVKCTGKLHGIIEEAGGDPEMYKTGHSLIKNRMKEVNAPFAAEMSGHFFFTDRWYGFDCGIYSAARLLEILAKDERTPEQVLSSLPNDISTPELKVEMKEGENHEFIESFVEKARFADARVNKIDGLRADWSYGWGLVRASNTTPILVVRFEADSEESLNIIKEAFRLQMTSVRSDLKLPF